MIYVEWLRVRNALKTTLIVLAVFFVIAGILRVAVNGIEKHEISMVTKIQNDPSSKVTESTLPDGTARTTIVGSDGTHVTIDDHGYQGKHIEILDPTDRDAKHEVNEAGMRVETIPQAHGSLTLIDTDGQTPFRFYAYMGLLVASILATIMGAAFAKENDGHLEIAWTKPVGRIALALGTIGADIAGIVAGFVLGVVCAIASQALYEAPHISFEFDDALLICLGILTPIAWYALLNAATASLKRGVGPIVGLAWPIAIVIFGLNKIQSNGNALLTIVQGIFHWINFINPFAYMMMMSMTPQTQPGPFGIVPIGLDLAVIVALILVYSAAAIAQWRRVEA